MKALLVAGGSGGHLTPALTLAEYLEGSDQCTILSTRRAVDQTLAARSAKEWITVDLERFTPLWKWLLPGYTLKQLRAIREIWKLLQRIRPDVVIGFGGYLSAVGVVAARSLNRPTVVHEQNLLPGRANRWLSRFSDVVAVSFPETKSHLARRTGVETTGNPVRCSLKRVSFEEARESFGFDQQRPVLLVMGGSQGSEAINRLVVSMWERQPVSVRQKMQVLHLAGSREAASVQAAYRRMDGIQAEVMDFLHEMERALAAATLCICRSGATTIAELVASQVPAVLIPYPHAGGHQLANAAWMRQAGGAVVLEEAGLSSDRLWQEIEQLLWDRSKLDQMRQALGLRQEGSSVERLGGLVRRIASSHSTLSPVGGEGQGEGAP